jgi:CubicO group peptidase (beta-lactamase class C family)
VFNLTKDGAWRGAGLAIGNGGWHVGGYSSGLAVLPSRGLVISVMTNTGGDPRALVSPVTEALASAL